MSIPVLSKKQQKKANTGKKGSAKGLRNVLAQPYDFFWPILRDDSTDELKLLMQTLMPAIKRTSPKIPWSKLYKLKKAERKIARNEAQLKLNIMPPDENIVKSIVMGVNGITRLLEKDDALCVLLEANLDSMFFIKHIVIMADLKNVPCIIVPFLKSVMLDTVGIGSAAVALKKVVAASEDHHFHELYKKVAKIASDLEKSKAAKVDVKSPDICSMTVEETSNITQSSCNKQEVKSNDSFKISTDVYKYRSSRSERVFVPRSSTGSENVEERLDSNFISMGEDLDFIVCNDGHSKKRTRYVDIREKNNKNSVELKDDKMQLDTEYISMNPDSQCYVSSDDEMCNLDSEILHETKPAVLELTKRILPNSESDELINKNDRESMKYFKYQSLKVKRLQGNSKRVKATKVPKRSKK